MKAPKKLAVMITIILGITPAASAAQARGPLPISEAEAGLLSQASISPPHARLAAFGAFPGAQMVAAEIRRQENHLIYSFDLKFSGREGLEQVQIDAATGQVTSLEYTVERDQRGKFMITGPENLVSLVKVSFTTALATAESLAKDGHIVGSRLRVRQSRAVYVFDVEIGEDHSLGQLQIDARKGTVISAPQPI